MCRHLQRVANQANLDGEVYIAGSSDKSPTATYDICSSDCFLAHAFDVINSPTRQAISILQVIIKSWSREYATKFERRAFHTRSSNDVKSRVEISCQVAALICSDVYGGQSKEAATSSDYRNFFLEWFGMRRSAKAASSVRYLDIIEQMEC